MEKIKNNIYLNAHHAINTQEIANVGVSADFPNTHYIRFGHDDFIIRQIKKLHDKANKNKGQSLLLLSLIPLAACGGGGGSGAENVPSIATSPSAAAPAVEADQFIGTSGNDTLNASNEFQNLRIDGKEGNDSITGGFGNDVIKGGDGNDTIKGGFGADQIRAGAGNDEVEGGSGDDIIVIVGVNDNGGSYTAADITKPGGVDLSGLITLAEINSSTSDEAGGAGGRDSKIDGGAGNDQIHIYGKVDLSGINITGVESIIINSEVKLNHNQVGTGQVTSITGDGGSTIEFTGSGEVDLSDITSLTGINKIKIDSGVTVIIDNIGDLTRTGVKILEGGTNGYGTLRSTTTLASSSFAGITVDDISSGGTGLTIDNNGTNVTDIDNASSGLGGTALGGASSTDGPTTPSEPTRAEGFNGLLINANQANESYGGTNANDLFKVTKTGVTLNMGGSGNAGNDRVDGSEANLETTTLNGFTAGDSIRVTGVTDKLFDYNGNPLVNSSGTVTTEAISGGRLLDLGTDDSDGVKLLGSTAPTLVYRYIDTDNDNTNDAIEFYINSVPVAGADTSIYVADGLASRNLNLPLPSDANALDASLTIRVTEIPNASIGQIQKADGTQVTLFTNNLTAADIPLLKFVPANGAEGSDGDFSYTVSDANGGQDAQTIKISVGYTQDGDTYTGSGGAERLTLGDSSDDIIVNAGQGDDTITTGAGNDLVRAGGGKDTVNTGAGNDIVVIVGDTTGHGYDGSENVLNEAADGRDYNGDGDQTDTISLSSILSSGELTGASAITTSELVSGESYNLGVGHDVVVLYGTFDLDFATNIANSGVEIIKVNSEAIVSAEVLQAIMDAGIEIVGGADSKLTIKKHSDPSKSNELNIKDSFGVTGIGSLEVQDGVTLKFTNAEALGDIFSDEGAAIAGQGTIELTVLDEANIDADFFKTKNIQIDKNMKLKAKDNDSNRDIEAEDIGAKTIDAFRADESISVSDATGDDVLAGTGKGDLFTFTNGGKDTVTGGAGRDIFAGTLANLSKNGSDSDFVTINDFKRGDVIRITDREKSDLASTPFVANAGNNGVLTIDFASGADMAIDLNGASTTDLNLSTMKLNSRDVDTNGDGTNDALEIYYNTAPKAGANKTIRLEEDSAATSLNLFTPTDRDGDTITITVTAIPASALGKVTIGDNASAVTVNQTLTLAQFNTLKFTPVANKSGQTTFKYKVSDGLEDKEITATLDVIDVNDRPEISVMLENGGNFIDEHKVVAQNIATFTLRDDDLASPAFEDFRFNVSDDRFEVFKDTANSNAITLRKKLNATLNFPADNNKDITVTATDAFGAVASATINIGVNDKNDKPVILNLDGKQAVANVGTAVKFSDVVSNPIVSDDQANLGGGTLTIELKNAQAGEGLSGLVTSLGTITTTGSGVSITKYVVALNASATPAAIQQALSNVAFTNNGARANSVVTAEITLKDGNGASAATSDVTKVDFLIADADTPNLDLNGALAGARNDITITEDAAANVPIAPNATFSDNDVTDFGGYTLVVSGQSGANADAGRTLASTATAGSNGIATIAGGTNGANLTITFASSATATQVQSAMRSITTKTVSDKTSDELTVVLSKSGGESVTRKINVTINPNNDDSALSLGNAAGYTENANATTLFASATITDSDSSNFDQGSLKIETVTSGANDSDVNETLSFSSGSSSFIKTQGSHTYIENASDVVIGKLISSGNNGGDLEIKFNSRATAADIQSLIRDVKYKNNSDNPVATRDIKVTVKDGDGGTSTQTKSVTITASDDATQIAGLNGDNHSYKQQNKIIGIDAGRNATVRDADTANFDTKVMTVATNDNNATLSVLSNSDYSISGRDLKFNNTVIGQIDATDNGAPTKDLKITFDADATPQIVQGLYRAISYKTSSVTPNSNPDKTVSVTFAGNTSTVNIKHEKLLVRPNVTNLDGDVIAYREGASAIKIDAGGNAGFVDNTPQDTIIIVDVDGGVHASEKLTIDVPSGSNFATTYRAAIDSTDNGDGKKLKITFANNAETSHIQNLLRNIKYETDQGLGQRKITINVNDVSDEFILSPKTVTVNVTNTNDAPVFANDGGNINYSENAVAIVLDNNMTISDEELDLNNYNGATMTFSRAGGKQAEDVFSFATISGLTIANGKITSGSGNNAKDFANIINSGDGELKITFTDEVSSAEVDSIIQAVKYNNTNEGALANRNITINGVFNDASGAANNTDTTTFNMTLVAVNDAPVFADDGDNIAYREDAAAVVLDANMTISDKELDANNYNGAHITFARRGGKNSDDVFEFSSMNGVTFTNTQITRASNGQKLADVANTGNGELKITFTANASAAEVDNIIQAVKYKNQNESFTSNQNYIIDAKFDDGQGANNRNDTTSFNITYTPVNDAIAFANTAGNANYNEGSAAVVLDSDITISDKELDVLNGNNGDYDGTHVTIKRAGGTANSEDVFEFATMTGLTVSGANIQRGGTTIATFTNSSGTLKINFNQNRDVTKAEVNKILQAIEYKNTNETFIGNQTINLTAKFNDKVTDSTATLTAIVTPVNDLAVFANENGNAAYTEDAAAVVLDPNVTISDKELDDLNGGNGDYNQAVFTLSRTGGKNNEDVYEFNNFTSGSALSVSANGNNIVKSGSNIATIANTGDGELKITFTGTTRTSELNEIIQAIKYKNTNESYTISPTVINLTAKINDRVGNNTATLKVDLTPVNDAIAFANTAGNAAYTEDVAAVVLDPNVSVSDKELDALQSGNGDYDGTHVTIRRAGGTANSEDVFEFATMTGLTVSGANIQRGGTTIATFTNSSGTLKINFNQNRDVTKAEVNKILQAIEYKNTNETFTSNQTINLEVKFNDGVVDSSATLSAVVTPVNDAPVFANEAGNAAYNENGAAVKLDTNFSISDKELDASNYGGSSFTLQRSGGTANSNDVFGFSFASGSSLSFASNNIIKGSGASATTLANVTNANGRLKIDFTNATTVANEIDTILQSITYQNTQAAFTSNTRINLEAKIDDGSGVSASNSDSAILSVDVTPVNDAPTNINVAQRAIAVGTDISAGVDLGLLSSTDEEGDTVTYSITGGGDQSLFSLTNSNTKLKITDSANALRNAGQTYEVKITATDNNAQGYSGGNQSTEATLNILVGGLDTDRSDGNGIDLTQNENINTASGLTLGDLRDQTGFTNPTFAIVGNANGFSINSGNLIYTGGVLDFESQPSYSVNIKVTDSTDASQNYTQTLTLQVQDLNEAPTVTPANMAITEGATILLTKTHLGVVDQDATDGDSQITVTLTNIAGGKFQKDNGSGFADFSSSAPIAFTLNDVANNKVRFVSDGSETTPAFKIQAKDNSSPAATSPVVDARITFTKVNDLAVFANENGNAAYTEDVAAVALDSNVTISDEELDALNSVNGDYNQAVFTLSRATGKQAEDKYEFGAITGLTVSGNNIVKSGSNIATIANTGDGELKITFTATTTTAEVNRIIQAIKYKNTNETFTSNETINLTAKFNDKVGDSTATLTAVVTPVNDIIAFANTVGNAAYTEDAAAVVLDSNVSVSDKELDAKNSGNGDYDGTNVVIRRAGGTANSDDVFEFATMTGLTVSGANIQRGGNNIATFTNSSGTLTINFNQNRDVTTAEVNKILQAIKYKNTNETFTSNQTINLDVKFNDSAADSTATLSVDLTHDNDLIAFANTTGNAAYTEGANAVVLDNDVAISDKELDAKNSVNGDYNGTVFTLSRAGGKESEDVFEFASISGLTVSGNNIVKSGSNIATIANSGDGELKITFTATTTTAEVNNIVKAIKYKNTNETFTGNETINLTAKFNDTVGDSTATLSAVVTPVNDIIAFANTSGNASYTEDAAAVVLDGNVAVSDKELDAKNSGNGDYDGTYFTIKRAGGTANSEDVFEFATMSGLTVSGSNIQRGGNNIATITNSSGTLKVDFNQNRDVTTAEVNKILQAIKYKNTNETFATSQTINLEVKFNDGAADATATLSAVVTPVNDLIALANTAGNAAYSEGANAVVLDNDVTVSDKELDILNSGNGDYNGTVFTLSRAGGKNNEDVYEFNTMTGLSVSGNNIVKSGTNIATIANTGDGELKISFTATTTKAEVNRILQAIEYKNTNETYTTSQTINLTAKFNDGVGDSASTLSVVVTPVNDAPVFANDGGNLSYSENANAIDVDNNMTISDKELDANNYNGAHITFARSTGAVAEDIFSFDSISGVGIGVSSLTRTSNSQTLANFTNSGGELKITFTANVTAGEVDSIIQAVKYSNNNETSPANRNITINAKFNDGASANNTDTATFTTTLVAVNDLIAFADTAGNASFLHGGSAVVLDNNMTVSDKELDALNSGNGDYDGASFTLARTGGANSNDKFEFGTVSGLTFSNTRIDRSGTQIATVTNTGNGTLKIEFNQSANVTSAEVDNILQAIEYKNTVSSISGPSTVNLTLTANDGTGNSTATLSADIVVSGNVAPVITTGNNISVAENIRTAATIVATDANPSDTKTFSLVTSGSGIGADHGLFTIDSATGKLRFKTAPDFENKKDADNNGIYEVSVKVTDSAGASDTEKFAITVTNANEVAPSRGGMLAFTAASSVTNIMNLSHIKAEDPDATDGTLTYSLTSIHEIGGASAVDKSSDFALNANTGILSQSSGALPAPASGNNDEKIYKINYKVKDNNATTSNNADDIEIAREVYLRLGAQETSAANFSSRNHSVLFLGKGETSESITGTNFGDTIFTNITVQDRDGDPAGSSSGNEGGADTINLGNGNDIIYSTINTTSDGSGNYTAVTLNHVIEINKYDINHDRFAIIDNNNRDKSYLDVLESLFNANKISLSAGFGPSGDTNKIGLDFLDIEFTNQVFVTSLGSRTSGVQIKFENPFAIDYRTKLNSGSAKDKAENLARILGYNIDPVDYVEFSDHILTSSDLSNGTNMQLLFIAPDMDNSSILEKYDITLTNVYQNNSILSSNGGFTLNGDLLTLSNSNSLSSANGDIGFEFAFKEKGSSTILFNHVARLGFGSEISGATGTAANNQIKATSGNDTINAGAGNDVVAGNGGNDTFVYDIDFSKLTELNDGFSGQLYISDFNSGDTLQLSDEDSANNNAATNLDDFFNGKHLNWNAYLDGTLGDNTADELVLEFYGKENQAGQYERGRIILKSAFDADASLTINDLDNLTDTEYASLITDLGGTLDFI